MDSSLFSTLGQIAGIGGLALGVLLLLFRDVIKKNIFPMFKDEQLAYRLLRLIVALTFAIAVCGIAAWLATTWMARDSGPLIGEAHVAGDLALAEGDLIMAQYNQTFSSELDEDTRALVQRAANLVEGGLDQEALKLYRDLAQQVDVPAIRVNLAILEARAGDPDAARENLREAVASDPDYTPARLALGLLDAQEGRFEEAVRQLERVPGDEARRITEVLREQGGSGAFENEPNDNTSEANTLVLGVSVQGGVRGDDRDLFGIRLPPGNTDRFEVQVETMASDFATRLRVLDGNGDEVVSTSGTIGGGARTSFIGDGSEFYFVEVERRYGGGSYRLRVEPRSQFDAHEPNETDDQATPIALGSTVEANILARYDVDTYRFTTPSGPDSLRVRFTNRSENLHPVLTLVDGSGGSRTFRPGTNGASFTTAFPVRQRQEYVLRVAAWTSGSRPSEFGGWGGAYTLEVAGG
jgi:hypothetical protein